VQPGRQQADNPANRVDPFIGTDHGGNTFPGAVMPFGMLAWSPETTRGHANHPAAPGGYAVDATRLHGFSLTHLSGTGCRGASGDVPILPLSNSPTASPSADMDDAIAASGFMHAQERAKPGMYGVHLDNGVDVELTATRRTGFGHFAFPPGGLPTLLFRVSDSEVGSSDAHIELDAAQRTISGWVKSGNFCGYLGEINRHSYYTLHFVAVLSQPFRTTGTWTDDQLAAGATTASGGTGYGADGQRPAGKGSGGYVTFDPGASVDVRVGISYVSEENARANLASENPANETLANLEARAHTAWRTALSRIEISGGSDEQRTIFATALYHSLLHPNLFSDVNGEYWGFDQRAHHVAGRQGAQYANFSGWDVYRCQLQLVALLEPEIASDIAQSLLNQADQNGGEWDRWTHNSGAAHVMEGDPSPASIAGILAFGGNNFDVPGAYASLKAAATQPSTHDLSHDGCPVECTGERPSLDQWLKQHYIAAGSHSWAGAGETLEDVAADYSLAQLARRTGDHEGEAEFLRRSGYWRNLFNPKATATEGFIQNRNLDGTWPAFDPAAEDDFAEGSGAQYLWMIPFDAAGLFEVLGGTEKALGRLDGLFRAPDGTWALTKSGGLHAEMDNEPSIGAPWMYVFGGRPARTQEIIRTILGQLWHATPAGIPGNDDLGAMSSWYVWSALGMYPEIPGRSELILGSPLFPSAIVHRSSGPSIIIHALENKADTPFVQALTLNGRPTSRAWLPGSFVARGGTLDFTLGSQPSPTWGTQAQDLPPTHFETP
jgi:predicted alpha-1,2-mannosidase